MSDPVREYLREKGCAQHVIRGGLEGLIGAWEKTVESVERGYELSLDDYLNDLDGRQLIEETLAIDGVENAQNHLERVRPVDERMRNRVRLTGTCLWGNAAATRHGWSADKNWWYFSVPKTAGPELLIDLNSDRR
jgi:hypothetical protein